MLGFLNVGIPLEFEITPMTILIVVTAAFVFAGILMYFVGYWMDVRNKQPELDVLRRCRKKPFPPVIIVIDGAGKLMFFVGEKEKKASVNFKKEDYGMLIDPAILTKKPKSTLIDGTSVYFYGTDTHFPVDPLGARGIVQIINSLRYEFKIFEYIKNDFIIMELIMKEGEDLMKDCETIIKKNEIVDGEIAGNVTAASLVRAIEEAKNRFKKYGISDGFFSFNDALERLPLGTVAGDFSRVIQIAKFAALNESKEDGKWVNAAMAFAIVAGVLILAALILS